MYIKFTSFVAFLHATSNMADDSKNSSIIQSDPFNLFVSSVKEKIGNSLLTSCHEGAATDALCNSLTPLSNISRSLYRLNNTMAKNLDEKFRDLGILTEVLHGVNFKLTIPMNLVFTENSSDAIPLFMPLDTGTLIGFDANDNMFVPRKSGDEETPPTHKFIPEYRWNMCDTNIGYHYRTLVWIADTNLSVSSNTINCEKICVTRKFITP
ncbi:BgTH12-06196 [Blumeria graminis f. sp. triticale]|uniref:Bgt-3789 n=3 Tax=Blumeria graminis TaxID=34373 RepID=A0A381L5N2_BLUGR|nr:hypothetical protein BGT96224_3789 [Blumeria graminis f. sp. tritici 96224]CAD6504467.1 BgTH12-06196 [Blumeria graminis f. sp. triticale]VDB91365.1 Bgt-3789 [Blumeria graminis f. sp. tritici]